MNTPPCPKSPLYYLLDLVGEECNEVAEAALKIGKVLSKASRFGLLDQRPGSGVTNLEALQGEVSDLIGSLRLLNAQLLKAGLAPIVLDDESAIEKKMEKVRRFAHRSMTNERLTELF
ncbi:hypothetical protein LUCX_212 [Xanthomonas phage vB_XciM_LucasX]|nr:hypothetical protein LUCX_212 [Xanthomonas phage vB_XciM_LucasX]